jgi:hypothetical protein
MTSEVLTALVDYDNAREIRREITASDVQANLDRIASRVAEHAKTYAGALEVRMRLYGGWTDLEGRYTRQAERVMAAVESVRGTRGRVRVMPEVATTLAAAPAYELKGLHRVRDGIPVQKMVDTVLCIDAVHLGRFGAVAIVSDDDDIMIGALAAGVAGGTVHLLRERSEGRGLNDSTCRALGVRIFKIV